jgi:SAM-dependent methyltransferase
MKLYNKCRCCGNLNLTPWLSLPKSPVANALFVEPNYERYPLDLNYCVQCGHLQLAGAPDPDGVFSEYRYRSGVSSSFKKHFAQYAKDINALFDDSNNSVLEIGSNDGYLLQQFKDLGWSTIGVEPSEYLIEDHSAKGVDLVTGFFSTNLVQEKSWAGKFDLICANNVLAHIPDMLDVVTGISQALVPGGTLVVECGDQSGIISGKYLDNVYHEHIDYYSPYSFSKLLERVGMTVVDVQPMNTHGVSFRLIAKNQIDSNTSLPFVPVDVVETSTIVSQGIVARQEKMNSLINGRPFVAYGAAAKAVTALYTLNMVDEKLIGVVDDNELKQNCYFPGTNIMITSPTELDKNALVVITAWNVYEDIKNKLVERGHTGEILCMQ